MRFTSNKPLSLFSKIFRPNTSKKSKFGKASSEGRKAEKKTIRTFLNRSHSADNNNEGGAAESGGGSFLDFMRLRKKILTFRDIFDIPPISGSVSIQELVMETIDDLNRMYPDLIPGNPMFKMKDKNTHQGLLCLYYVLERVTDSWVDDSSMRNKFKKPHIGSSPLDELVQVVLEMLDCINKSAKERFELMDVERKHEFPGLIKVKPNPNPNPFVDCNSEFSRSSSSRSPHTPNSVLPESPKFADLLGAMMGSYSSSQLLNLKVQAVEELSPMDLKRLVSQVMPHLKANGNGQLTPKLASIEEGIIEASDNNNNVGENEPSCSNKNETETSDTFDNEPNETESPTPTEDENEVLDKVQQQPLVEEEATPLLRSSAHPPPPPPSPSYSPPHPTLPPPPNTTSVPPPPPPPGPSPPPVTGKEGRPQPPGQTMKRGDVPPPPGGMRSIVCPKNRTKLKRSTHMGSLYRTLRGRVEGSCMPGGRSSPGHNYTTNGGSSGGGGGGGGGPSMADALAEMTKRSTYFHQIEEDMEKHEKAIKELQRELNLFKTKDMDELHKFHNRVESLLEILTDETQILSKFEGFPMNKLETLRMAAALSTKLNGIVSEIHNWKIEPPLADNLDKVEKFFTKIKAELEGLERTKDEESRTFQSQNIHFDFSILTKIKESMVDLSSGFIELALKEKREEKEETADSMSSKTEGKQTSSVKMLWRAFQFAFKVYSFAGGQDDRADSLTRELAKEIETHPVQE